MPLKNPKHERFAQLVAQGKSKREAAETVGFGKKNSSSQGTNLAKSPKVAQRIAELQSEVVQKTIVDTAISKSWVLDRLKENVERALQAVPARDNEGKETGEYRYEGNVANRGLELLGKYLGMFDAKPDKDENAPRPTVMIGMPDAEPIEAKPPNADALKAAGKSLSVN